MGLKSELKLDRVPTSFYIFLVASFIALIPACFDHGETWAEIKSGEKDKRCASVIKLLALWIIPILTIIGTIYLGIESVVSDREERQREADSSVARDEIAKEQLPMTLGNDVPFIRALLVVSNINVIVANNANDEKALITAKEIEHDLIDARWNVLNSGETNAYADGIVINLNADEYSDDNPLDQAAHLLLIALTDANLPARINLLNNPSTLQTNTLLVVAGERPDPYRFKMTILDAKLLESHLNIDRFIKNHPEPLTSAEKDELNRLEISNMNFSVEQVKESVKVHNLTNKTNGVYWIFGNNKFFVEVSNGSPVRFFPDRYTYVILTNGVPSYIIWSQDLSEPLIISDGTNPPVFKHPPVVEVPFK